MHVTHPELTLGYWMADPCDALNVSPNSPLGPSLSPLVLTRGSTGAAMQHCFPEQMLHFSFLRSTHSSQAIVYRLLADTKSHS